MMPKINQISNGVSKEKYLLIFILALALFLRLWGIEYGLPYFLINDERALVYGALKMGELKTLIPAFHADEFRILCYAPLMSYLYLIFLVPFVLGQYFFGSFANFAEIANYFTINPGPIWLITRIVNALMGVATVYLIYLVGKKAFNHWVGLISSLLLTFSLLHIQFSHFTRIWGPTLFFISLIMLLSCYIHKSPQTKYYLLIGIVSGLGFGTNYVVPVALFIFLIAHFLGNKVSFREKLMNKNLWLAVTVFILLAAVFILIYPQLFVGWTGLNRLEGAVSANRSLAELLLVFVIYIKTLFSYEPVTLILSLAGLLFLVFKSWRTFLIALSWPIFWVLIAYFIIHSGDIGGKPQNHYVLVIIPWLAVLGGFALYRLIFRFSLVAKVAMVALVFIYPLALAVQYDRLLAQKDTRIAAKDWVEEHIPAGAKIISNVGGVNPTPTKVAILFQKGLDEDSLRAADKALLTLEDKKYPEPAYNILKLAYINREKLSNSQLYQPAGYQYFLASFWPEEDLSLEEKAFLGKVQLIAEFKPDSQNWAEDIHRNRFYGSTSIIFFLERLGPIVRIYKNLASPEP